jgi:hypothetical protein
MKSYEEMLTPAALKLMQEKLRTMGIEEFTKDHRINRIFSRYRKETGGILLDLMERKMRTSLPNWNPHRKDASRMHLKCSCAGSTRT